MSNIYLGIDWSENLQDWAVIDDQGRLLGRGRFPETPEGIEGLHRQVCDLAETHADGALPLLGIETDKNLTVATLRRLGYPIYSINPGLVARRREDFNKGKSDRADARLLAEMVRVDLNHRKMPNVSDASLALQVTARAHQDQIWRIKSICQEIRSLLRLYYPAALEAFPAKRLDTPKARAVLRKAPTPAQAARVRKAGWRTLLSTLDSRNLDRDANRLREIFTAPTLRQDSEREAAMGQQLLALLDALDGAVAAAGRLDDQLTQAVAEHPMNALFESIHGVGTVTAARLLGELGDDPRRFANVRSVRAYAGTAPITRASGKMHLVNRRQAKNNRLTNALYMWSISATRTPSGREAYRYRREECGDRHNAALRNIQNRLVGCLWHCMATGEEWDERKVWGVHYREGEAVDPTAEEAEEGAALAVQAAYEVDQEDNPGDPSQAIA